MGRRAHKPKKPESQAPQARLAKANKEIRNGVPKRMRRIVDDFGGVTKFSRAHDLEPKHVYRWVSTGMVPNVDRLIYFAQKSNISPDWLLLGKGKPYLGGKRPAAAKQAA
jgi:hypothetical protein